MRIFTNINSAVYLLFGAETVPIQLSLPNNVTTVNRRPDSARYRGTMFFAGAWNKCLVLTPDLQLRAMGIEAPTNAPTAVVAANAAAIQTSVIYSFTFREKLPNGQIVAESNPSDESAPLALSNNGAVVSGIPPTAPDVRVTHIAIYRSDDAAIPKESGEVPIGVTTFTDVLSTAGLAGRTALPNLNGSQTFERGVPPYARFIEIYHDRMWFAGDPVNPDRIYFSKLFEPEGVGETSYIVTKDGEAVTGLKRVGDQLLVFCKRACYDIQGYSSDDFVIRKLSPSIGCISHFSIVNINERLWFASERGVYTYATNFQFVMEDLRSTWRDGYINDPRSYEDSVGVDDPSYMVYKLLIPQTSGSYYYVGSYKDYDPSTTAEISSQPTWSNDVRTRTDTAHGRLILAGTSRLELYTGSSDGIIRQENVITDGTDDSDTGNKRCTIVTKHFLYDDPGGDLEDGKTLVKVWSYVRNETASWTFGVFSGDENAAEEELNLNSKDDIPASLLANHVARLVFFHPIREKTVGRGFAFYYSGTGSTDFIFRGLGGVYGPGPAYRGSTV